MLLALITVLIGCESNAPENESGTDIQSAETSPSDKKNEYELISSPYNYLYNNARNVWDMEIHNGYLYIGAGDYDKNYSPAVARRYSLTERKWSVCGNIPDEQIDRLNVINGELYIPGCDPTGDWSMGNFYKLEGDTFTTYRNIPNAVHCFDIVEYNGKLFAALGLAAGDGGFPVAVSEDGGKSFSRVAVDKNGHSYSADTLRVYSLFVNDSALYALHGTNVYRYDGDKFVFAASWRNRYAVGYNFYTQIGANTYFNGRNYFTTGYLFHFESPEDLQYTIFESAIVTDIAVYGDHLYVLCAKQLENGNYLICLMKTSDGNNYSSVYTLEYELPALSFAFDSNDLYLGIGDTSGNNSKAKGQILKTEVEQ